MGNVDHREVVEATSEAIIGLYRWNLLFQIAGIVLVFGIWQVRQLERPWWNGPWHVVFFAWLAWYGSWASYRHRIRQIRTAASRCGKESSQVSSETDAWLESLGVPLGRSRTETLGCLLLPILPALLAVALAAEAIKAVHRRGLSPANGSSRCCWWRQSRCFLPCRLLASGLWPLRWRMRAWWSLPDIS